MDKDIAIQRIQQNFNLNHILAKILLESTKKKKFSNSDLELIFQDFLEIKPKPFVKWVGGKRQLLKQFRELGLYPPESFNPLKNTYFEPFVGGGAVFLDLLPKNVVLSDMNNELVITYNVIKNDLKKLISKLKIIKTTKRWFLFMIRLHTMFAS